MVWTGLLILGCRIDRTLPIRWAGRLWLVLKRKWKRECFHWNGLGKTREERNTQIGLLMMVQGHGFKNYLNYHYYHTEARYLTDSQIAPIAVLYHASSELCPHPSITQEFVFFWPHVSNEQDCRFLWTRKYFTLSNNICERVNKQSSRILLSSSKSGLISIGLHGGGGR